MKKRILIRNQQSKAAIDKVVADAIGLAVSGEPHVLTVMPKDELRSVLQNSLYWLWITRISQHRGEEKEAVHEELKGKFLKRIFERDDPEGYGAMLTELRALYADQPEVAKHLFKHVTKLTSTTKATVKQMTEYLEEVERYGVQLGADMTFPDEYKDYL